MSIRAWKPGRSLRVDPAAGAATPSAEPRIPELDALRGIAAVVIVIFHSNTRRMPWGWAAVDLFFVLSGFLITGIVLRHGGTRGFLGRFYARRALRIFPVYYLVMLGLVAFGGILPRPNDPRGLLYELTYTQFVPVLLVRRVPAYSPYLGHTWTLAIEEQFYLVWPALILLAGRFERRRKRSEGDGEDDAPDVRRSLAKKSTAKSRRLCANSKKAPSRITRGRLGGEAPCQHARSLRRWLGRTAAEAKDPKEPRHRFKVRVLRAAARSEALRLRVKPSANHASEAQF